MATYARRSILTVAALVLGSCSSSPGSVAQAQALRLPAPMIRLQSMSNLEPRLLAGHNRERAAAGVAPLRWDPALAAAAAAYGPALAAQGRLEHSPRASRPGQRENLWMGSRGSYSPEQMVGSWAEEKAYFRPGVFPNVSTTGNWLDVSHYTQMIWSSTTSVGCALHQTRTWDYLICRYSPPGNVDGRRAP
jgi:hypothetical protein